MKGCTEYGTSIQLFVDGELTRDEAYKLLAHLQSCQSCRQVVEEAKAFSQQIRAARPAIVAPQSLRAAVLVRMQQAGVAATPLSIASVKMRNRRKWSLAAAAAILIVAISTLLMQRRQQESKKSAMIQAAVLAHQELEQHATPLDISSGSSQEVATWFQSRVRFPFRMANSGIAAAVDAKYKLMGGRLLLVDNEPVALVAFSLFHEVITLLVCPDHRMKASGGAIIQSGDVVLHNYRQPGIHIVTWNEQGLGYVLTYRAKTTPSCRRCSSCHSRSPDIVEPGSTATFEENGTPLVRAMVVDRGRW
jgi:anti-sigma factor RsiW